MANILYVRLQSTLDDAELERRVNERRPRFLGVPGLMQKIYGRDEDSGEVCGIYFFENAEALTAYLESELAKTIPTAYEASSVRKEVYDVLFPLRPERGLV
ncbi:MAG: YdhR family protein [Desulfuromonadales bacterium]